MLPIKETQHEPCKVVLDLNMENRVIMVVMGVKLSLGAISEEFVSVDKKFFAGDIQEIGFVKNSVVVPFIEKITHISPIKVPKEVVKAKWIKNL